jgi:hypothetical protein
MTNLNLDGQLFEYCNCICKAKSRDIWVRIAVLMSESFVQHEKAEKWVRDEIYFRILVFPAGSHVLLCKPFTQQRQDCTAGGLCYASSR